MIVNDSLSKSQRSHNEKTIVMINLKVICASKYDLIKEGNIYENILTRELEFVVKCTVLLNCVIFHLKNESEKRIKFLFDECHENDSQRKKITLHYTTLRYTIYVRNLEIERKIK